MKYKRCDSLSQGGPDVKCQAKERNEMCPKSRSPYRVTAVCWKVNFSEFDHIREERLKIDNNTCKRCGRLIKSKAHAHHIIPIQNGGLNTLDNLVTLCTECHQYIHSSYNDGKLYPRPIIGTMRKL